jgi:O-antigen ligase
MRTLLFYACLPLVAYLGVTRPFWGLVIYLSANIIRPEMLFWGGGTGMILFKVSIGSTLLGYLLRAQGVFSPWREREFLLLLWVWLAVAASLVFSPISLAPKAWYYADELFKLCILAWLMLGLLKEETRVLRIVDVLLMVASLLALWGWDQSFRGNERLEGLGGNAFGDSNFVAAFAALFFPIALHKLLTATPRNQKLFGAGAALLLGVLIVLTKSRGGFLGLAAGTIYLLWRTPRKKALVTAMLIMLVLASPFVGEHYLQRLSTISSEQEERDYSAGSRLVLWNAGWLAFKDHPLFGVGLLNFAIAKAPYRDALAGRYDEELLDYAFQGYKVGHSTWFCQMLAEGGLFLTIPFLWLIFGFFRRAHRLHLARPPTEEIQPLHNLLVGLEAGIFAYCVSISFIDALLIPFLPIQILLGMQVIKLLEQKKVSATVPSVPREVMS